MKKTLILVLLVVMFIPFAFARADESSPYLMGSWFLDDHFKDGTTPVVTKDTQFTFLNPTNLGLNLEYAFFDEQGGFCGCDRDFLQPNGVVRYTMSGEAAGGQFVCTGNVAGISKQTHGPMKTIVFEAPSGVVSTANALQVGFQTQLLSNGSRTESGLKAASITPVTQAEIGAIHTDCVNFCNSHPGLCPAIQ